MNQDRERNAAGEEPKVGVYICHCGGNISDHVDVEKVENLAAKLPGVAVARRNMFMCSDPGQEMIMEDIKAGRINRVVVASCAPSLHETTFRGAIARAGHNPYLYEHANIREQVSWVHHGAGATAKAATLVSAAVAKAQSLEPLRPIRVNAWGHATVIGGGVAGLKAAGELSRRGIKVTLVEKTPFLGGNTAQLDLVFPTADRAGDLIEALVTQVLDDPNVQLLTCAEVTASEGYVGNFRLKVARRPPQKDAFREQLAKAQEAGLRNFVPFVGLLPVEAPKTEEVFTLETGAIILATGFRHYVPYKGEYGYAEFPQVVTLPDLIKSVAADPGGGTLRLGGREVRTVAMIHCVGSRQIPGVNEPPGADRLNEHCSRVCCTATLQAAVELRTKYPKTVVYDLFRDIRTYGRGHEEFYLNASRKAVRFLRFTPEQPPVVSSSVDGTSALRITVADTLLGGEEVEIPVDLVVLAVGMESGSVSSLVEMMKLPTGADGFLLEVHPKLRPVEVAASGILLAGTAQAPMDISESTAAASAAAVKASAILSRGYVELDPFVARVSPERCTGCGDCVEACLVDGALVMKETSGGQSMPEVNPALCKGCGVCVAACPEKALEVNGWTLQQYETMVDAIVSQPAAASEGGI